MIRVHFFGFAELFSISFPDTEKNRESELKLFGKLDGYKEYCISDNTGNTFN